MTYSKKKSVYLLGGHNYRQALAFGTVRVDDGW